MIYLVQIAVISSASILASMYILAATSYVILILAKHEFGIDIYIPEWILVYGYCLFTPIGILIAVFEKIWRKDESSLTVYNRQAKG